MPFNIPMSYAKARLKTKVNFIAGTGLNVFLIIFFLSYFFSAWNKMISTGIPPKKGSSIPKMGLS